MLKSDFVLKLLKLIKENNFEKVQELNKISKNTSQNYLYLFFYTRLGLKNIKKFNQIKAEHSLFNQISKLDFCTRFNKEKEYEKLLGNTFKSENTLDLINY